ncbi:MAG: 4Fe-4S dicluster domain-containing protein [Candidatus Hodarchaeota archaeon]
MVRLTDLFPILGEVTRNLLSKPITIEFPFEHTKVPDGYRGAPEVDPELCIVCKTCEKDCPTHCIKISPANSTEISDYSPEKGKPFWFSINLTQCMFCQQCEELCPVGRKGKSAITLNSSRWQMAEYKIEDAIETKLVYRRSKKESRIKTQGS